ncbi:MAG: alpha-L-fucosidase, partial [Oscillospiraceae bacterium]|nr:alpha-L-fucosidase [Oscillospiraceae bacterium]
MADFAQFGLAPCGAAPNERHMEWYARERTAFLHFGVNTFTDREWGDGTESEALFAPTELDCRQWARVLKEGGFTAAILTAKHHD